ncbi:MAG: hydrogenase maturation protease [Thermoplasmata archaeon]|nr:hydrogenase maturation protease [Thermoplasmata archaeon]
MHKLRDTPCESEEDLRRCLEEIAGRGHVYVLGLGYLDKADDGAGVLVAEALKKLFPTYSFSEHDGVEGTVLDISEKDEDATVFFVDAAALKSEPGTIRVIMREEIQEREITTHRVAVALLSSVLAKAGKRVAVIGIQPGTIEFRGEVSQPVAEAIAVVTGALGSLMKLMNRFISIDQ